MAVDSRDFGIRVRLLLHESQGDSLFREDNNAPALLCTRAVAH